VGVLEDGDAIAADAQQADVEEIEVLPAIRQKQQSYSTQQR
jgi:hypothetical protein